MHNFSVIIPIYNSEKDLNRCIDSVIQARKVFDVEIILVNDGSLDSSLTICQEYSITDQNIKIINKKNGGLSSARNAGLEGAEGKYICFVDSDDYLEADYFEVIYNNISESPDVLCFGYFRVQENLRLAKKRNISIGKMNRQLFFSSTHKSDEIWYVWRNVYNYNFLEKNNIDFDEKVKYGEDSIFLLKVFNKAHLIKCIDANLYNYVENARSLTQIKYRPNLLEELTVQFSSRKSIIVENVPLHLIKNDMSKYYINHSLFVFLLNVKNSPYNKLEELKKIRESPIYLECFKNYTYNWHRPKMSFYIKLFELKQYWLLEKIFR